MDDLGPHQDELERRKLGGRETENGQAGGDDARFGGPGHGVVIWNLSASEQGRSSCALRARIRVRLAAHLMSRIGNLQDFLDAVGPHLPVAGDSSVPGAPVPDGAGELLVEPLPISTSLEEAVGGPVELDSVTAVTRFSPR